MPSVDVIDGKKSKKGNVELSDRLFGVRPDKHIVHEALVMQQARSRQGTHSTKTRHFVSGGGKKPYRQKGTGRARAGTIRSPLWKGGGIIFGPHPRDYSYSMPKKAARKALASLLSAKLADGELTVMDKIEFSEPATKEGAALMSGLGLDGKTLVMVTGENRNAYLSLRNLKDVKVVRVENMNVFDLLTHKNLLTDQDAVNKLQQEVLK